MRDAGMSSFRSRSDLVVAEILICNTIQYKKIYVHASNPNYTLIVVEPFSYIVWKTIYPSFVQS